MRWQRVKCFVLGHVWRDAFTIPAVASYTRDATMTAATSCGRCHRWYLAR